MVESIINSQLDRVAWGTTTRAAGDFRSDVITTPSIGMLIAMATTSLGDDVFREDEVTMSFEREVASLCGQEAGVFVISGTMANQLSLRTLLSVPPYAIMADAR
ncbi:hypothetical protein LTS12_027743, partial [Elasticomyces elasticus]